MIMTWVQPGTSNILAMSPCFTSCRLIQTPPVPQGGLYISHASRTLTYFTQQTWTNPRAQHENTVLCGNLIGPIHAHAAKGILWRSPSQKKFLTESRRTETTASAASCSAAWSSCCPNGRKARRYWNGKVKTPKGKTGPKLHFRLCGKKCCIYIYTYVVFFSLRPPEGLVATPPTVKSISESTVSCISAFLKRRKNSSSSITKGRNLPHLDSNRKLST